MPKRKIDFAQETDDLFGKEPESVKPVSRPNLKSGQPCDFKITDRYQLHCRTHNHWMVLVIAETRQKMLRLLHSRGWLGDEELARTVAESWN